VDTIVLGLAGEAVEAFIEYLSGYVIELTVADSVGDGEPLVVVVDGLGRTAEGFVAIAVGTYNEDPTRGP
jgi:hypothetical protein